MYIPGTDTFVRVLRITEKDKAGLQRARTTGSGMAVGAVSAMVTDPNFIQHPTRGSIVFAAVTAAKVALAKRKRVERAEGGYVESGSSEAAVKAALYTEVPEGAAPIPEGDSDAT